MSPNRETDWNSEVLNSIRAAIFVLDPGGRIVRMNRYAERLAGCTERDAISKLWTELFEVQRQTAAGLNAALASGSGYVCDAASMEVRGRLTTFVALLELAPLQNGRGAYLLLRDVGREDRFRRARHLESMQHMAAALARDLNNLVGSLQGCTEDLSARLTRAGIAADSLRALQESARRTAAVLQQLQAFSRTASADPKMLDLNGVITGMRPVLGTLLGPSVGLEFALADRVAPVEADRVHIQEVLVNLAKHAGRSIPAGGRGVIRTYNKRVTEQEALDHPDFSPGEYVVVEFEYDRAGNDHEEEASLALSFIHVPDGCTNGMELPAAFGLLKQAGGHMYRAPGSSPSRWLLYWPVALDSRTFWPSAGDGAGAESVLVVEHQSDPRMSSGEVLLYRGYRVLEANNGPEALRVLKQQREPVHVLVTDVFMPSMGGLQLAAEVKKISPHTNIVFMSGYSPEILREHGFPPDAPLVRKPCTPEVLARTVRLALDGNSRPAAADD